MAELLIHIGLRKTGSSALQEALDKNRQNLNALDITYPQSLTKWPAHQELAWCFNSKKWENLGIDKHVVYEYYIDLIINNLAEKKTVILSSEDLSLLSFDINAMSYISQKIGKFKPSIIIYKRSPIAMHISNYKFDIISGRSVKSFAEYVFTSDKLCTYHQPLLEAAWRSAYPKVTTLKYEDIHKGQVLNHFLESTLDCRLEDEKMHLSNTGVDHDILMEALTLNKSKLSDSEIKGKKARLRNQYRQKIMNGEITRESDEQFLKKTLTEDQLKILRQIHSND